MLSYACNLLFIGFDFTRWGIDGDINRVSTRRLGYAVVRGIVYFVTQALLKRVKSHPVDKRLQTAISVRYVYN